MPLLRRLREQRQTWPTWARVLGSGWVLSPLLAFALVIGAFFGYGAYTRSQPTHYSRGGDFLAQGGGGHTAAGRAAKATGAGGHAKGAAAHGKGKQAKAGTGSGSNGTTSNQSTGGTSSHPSRSNPGESTSGGTTDAPSQPVSQSGPVLPRVGTYSIDVSGSEHVKFGPFSACTNTFPQR